MASIIHNEIRRAGEHVSAGIMGARPKVGMVIPPRFERGTPRLGIWCSILLSYGTTARTHTKAGA